MGRSPPTTTLAAFPEIATPSAPFVPSTTTWSAAPSPAPPTPRSTVDVADVRGGEVVDGDDVGAAERVEVDPLEVARVHDDARDVAGEAQEAAVRRHVDLLGDVGAVEEHRVDAGVAVDRSLPSPGSHWNVSSAAPSWAKSLPRLPSTKSVPSPATIVSTPCVPLIVSLPGAAVDPEPGRLRLLAGAGDHVVAAEPVDERLVGRRRRDGDESPAGPGRAGPSRRRRARACRRPRFRRR